MALPGPAPEAAGRPGNLPLAAAALSFAVCLLHAGFFSAHPLFDHPVVDAAWHMEWAGRIAAGDITAYAPFFRAPLYPMLLGAVFAAAGRSMTAVALLSSLLTAASSAILASIARRIMPRGPAVAASAIWALWAPSFFLSATALLEPLYLVLLMGAFLALESGRPSAGMLLLGLSVVTRPGSALLLPAAVASAGLTRGLRRLPLFALPIAAVWAVNAVSGDPLDVVSSQGGINFYIGNSPDSDGYTAFAPMRVPPREPGAAYSDNVHDAAVLLAPEGLSASAVSSWWSARTLRGIADDPAAWLGLMARKLLYLFSPVEIPGNYDMYYCRRFSPPLRLLLTPPPVAFPGLLLFLLLPGALLAGKPSGAEARLLLWSLLLAAGTLAFFVTSRLRLPCVPFLVPVLVARFASKWRKGLALMPLGAAAGIALAAVTGGTVEKSGVNMPFHDALAHVEAGDAEGARALFMEAIDRSFERGDRISQNRTDAMYDLGLLELREGRPEEAGRWWMAALADDPSFEPAAAALAILRRTQPGDR